MIRLRFSDPTRRSFLAGASAALVGTGLAVAQQHLPAVGWLGTATRQTSLSFHDFWQAMANAGYVEGQDYLLVARFRNELIPAPIPAEKLQMVDATLAGELVALQPAVLACQGGEVLRSLAMATSTIPIVTSGAREDLLLDLAGADFGKPGKNVTGVSSRPDDLGVGKLIETMLDAFPQARRIIVVRNEVQTQWEPGFADYEAVRMRGKDLVAGILPSGNLEAIPEMLASLRPDAVIAPSVTLTGPAVVLIKWANETRTPVLYWVSENVPAGGLMSYGPADRDNWAIQANYISRLLKGAKVADLPIISPPMRLQLNAQAARLQGLEFPSHLIARADVVIE